MTNDITALAHTGGTSRDQGFAPSNQRAIALLLVSAFVVILNETMMGVALPRLMRDLDITAHDAQWVTTGFLLTMAVAIPITGHLLQRLDTRSAFVTAMSLFSLGTLICANASGIEVLISGRVVQAMGTAIMMPLLMTTVMNLVPPQARGRTMGNISIVISVAPAIGPTVSGVILSVLEWRWIFILMLPVAFGALALGAIMIKSVTDAAKGRLDVVSVLLSIIGFGGFVYGLSSLSRGVLDAGNITSAPMLSRWLPIMVGVTFIAMFIFRQLTLQKSDRALLNLRALTSRNFSVSASLMAISMMSMFGVLILLPIYLQNVLGLSALQSGLTVLPGGLIMGFCAPFVGRLYDRFGPTPLIVPGSILMSASLWSLESVNETTGYGHLLAAHITLSIGLALMSTPLFAAGLGSLKREFYSHGSAILSTIQQLAAATGTALFVTLMNSTSATLVERGLTPTMATARGIQQAFFVGAMISLLAVVTASLVRRPGEGPDADHNAKS